MIDKIWELFTSSDKIDRLVVRLGLLAILVGMYFGTAYIGLGFLIAAGLLLIGIIVVLIVMKKSDDKAEEAWQRLLNEEDDGVTGYIAVRPEELDGAPWEKRR